MQAYTFAGMLFFGQPLLKEPPSPACQPPPLSGTCPSVRALAGNQWSRQLRKNFPVFENRPDNLYTMPRCVKATPDHIPWWATEISPSAVFFIMTLPWFARSTCGVRVEFFSPPPRSIRDSRATPIARDPWQISRYSCRRKRIRNEPTRRIFGIWRFKHRILPSRVTDGSGILCARNSNISR